MVYCGNVCIPAPLGDINYNMTHTQSLLTQTQNAPLKTLPMCPIFAGKRRKQGKEDASLEMKLADIWWERFDTAWKCMYITFIYFFILIALIIRRCEPGKFLHLEFLDIEHTAQNKHL